MRYSQCKLGLNDYKYCASLGIRHPKLSANAISQRLKLEPDNFHSCGEAKKAPRVGTYESTYWSKELSLEDDVSLGTYIGAFASQFQEHARVLQEIHATGGRTEVFIGIFARALCDDVYPCEHLARLGELKIDLRLDFYGPRNFNEDTFREGPQR